MTPDGQRHMEQLRACADEIRAEINGFTLKTFQCRGGRRGSGMGAVMEGLWGFFARQALSRHSPDEYEIAWMVDNEYNDFALLEAGADWEPATHQGEHLRIEAKSMNLLTKETKGHFDPVMREIGEDDLLLVLLWRWSEADGGGKLVYPKVVGEFLGPAREIAALRDALHVARGGKFIGVGECPDCDEPDCVHVGEPLNANGVRERRHGPPSTKGAGTSYAANFGGLRRMVATSGEVAAAVARQQRSWPIRAEYLDFVATFPELRGDS